MNIKFKNNMAVLFLKISSSVLVAITVFTLSVSGYLYYNLFIQQKDVNLVIIEHNGGRLGNQLKLFLNMAAFSLEKNYYLYNPTFYENAHHFECFHNNLFLSHNNPFVLPFLPRSVINKIESYLLNNISKKAEQKIPDTQKFFSTPKNDKIFTLPPTSENFPELKAGSYFFYGWGFENKKGIEKHRKKLLEIFKPIKVYRNHIDSFFNKIDPKRLRIAVHVRQDDFRKWKNGANFYSIQQFKEHMTLINKRYQIYRPIFIITSDEPRSADEFQGLDVLIHQGNPIVDIYTLASCDIVMGVKDSTYAEWASWYGGTPLYLLGERADWDKLDQAVLIQIQKNEKRISLWNSSEVNNIEKKRN
jgi:hypothetical protein